MWFFKWDTKVQKEPVPYSEFALLWHRYWDNNWLKWVCILHNFLLCTDGHQKYLVWSFNKKVDFSMESVNILFLIGILNAFCFVIWKELWWNEYAFLITFYSASFRTKTIGFEAVIRKLIFQMGYEINVGPIDITYWA